MKNGRTLLLDKNCMALSLVTWRRAIKLLISGKAEAIDDNVATKIRGLNGIFVVPTILKLVTSVPWVAHRKKLNFTRRNMMARDQNTCQYCGKKVGKNASIDHVIPKSKGGSTDYRNCVTCCKTCNNLKADKTPEEAGMKLMKKPKRPTLISIFGQLGVPEEWKDYLLF